MLRNHFNFQLDFLNVQYRSVRSIWQVKYYNGYESQRSGTLLLFSMMAIAISGTQIAWFNFK